MLLGFALPTVGAADARNQVVTREPRVGLHSAKPMGVVVDVNS